MGKCETCGNEYDKSFDVITADGGRHTFDSFECAASLLAMDCENCGCRILGHGVESSGSYFCCAHCARQSGVSDVRDRDESERSAH